MLILSQPLTLLYILELNIFRLNKSYLVRADLRLLLLLLFRHSVKSLNAQDERLAASP